MGNRKATETVQLYIHDIAASYVRPVKELKGFKKVTLDAGEEQTISFIITEEMLKFYTANRRFEAEKGKFEVFIDNSSKTDNKAVFTLI